MSRIDISAEELDTIPYGTLQNRLSQADDWSNFKTLYLATNSLHVKMYFLEKGATALRSKSSTAATKLANQLKSAGFTLTYDSSGKVQEIIPPASTGPLFVDYNPFVITDTGDITNPDDSKRFVSALAAFNQRTTVLMLRDYHDWLCTQLENSSLRLI